MNKLHSVTTYVALVLFLSFFSSKVQADVPVESSIESRLYLMFQAEDSALQGLLPEPWRVNAVSSGPSKGANLSVIFIQTFVCDTPEGKPSPSGGTARYVVITVQAKNAQTGEESTFVTRIYTTDPARVPGHYMNAVKADIRREFSSKAENGELGTGSDYWEMKDSRGGIIKVRADYNHTALNHVKWERTIRTNAAPELAFIYHVDQSSELLKSSVTGADLLTNYNFLSSVSEHSGYLNDKLKLISVTEIPSFSVHVTHP